MLFNNKSQLSNDACYNMNGVQEDFYLMPEGTHTHKTKLVVFPKITRKKDEWRETKVLLGVGCRIRHKL